MRDVEKKNLIHTVLVFTSRTDRSSDKAAGTPYTRQERELGSIFPCALMVTFILLYCVLKGALKGSKFTIKKII